MQRFRECRHECMKHYQHECMKYDLAYFFTRNSGLVDSDVTASAVIESQGEVRPLISLAPFNDEVVEELNSS